MDKIRISANYILQQINQNPEIAIISGSNSIDIDSEVNEKVVVNYKDIPGFPISTVKGHEGKLLSGVCSKKNIIILKGRFHYYEGYNMVEVTHYVRVLALLGVKTIIITNAAGAINPSFSPGDIMLIKDHISLFMPECPLRGENLDEFGVRFPDMTDLYNKEMRSYLETFAQKMNVKLRQGVYVFLQGPKYETPAEIKLLELLKADAVGMSTVPEAIVAKHCGMNVVGLSCITNMSAGISEKTLTHKEVLEVGNKTKEIMSKIVCGIVNI